MSMDEWLKRKELEAVARRHDEKAEQSQEKMPSCFGDFSAALRSRRLCDNCDLWRGCRDFTFTADVAKAKQKQEANQPAPVANDKPAVWPLVIMDMASRDQVGRARYGVPLQPHNGRDALRDAYEEALDLCAYLRQAIMERDGR